MCPSLRPEQLLLDQATNPDTAGIAGVSSMVVAGATSSTRLRILVAVERKFASDHRSGSSGAVGSRKGLRVPAVRQLVLGNGIVDQM